METFQDKLKTIEDSDLYPFHMPGHKRVVINADMQNPYRRDITEIDGFDNLHCAEGFILEEERFAAELFGADESHYLVNGSSCGILAAMMTVSAKDGDFLIARNVHRSVFHGLYLSGRKADFVYPMCDKDLPFGGSVSVEDIKEKLAYRNYAGILITSPTYEGIVSDIRGICETAHEKGIPVIVDEAHGAHLGIFGADGYFPESAVCCGADLVIQSTHKTLPAMTQTALLHVQGDLIDRERLKFHLAVFQSSSPSYILMESISDSLHYCSEHKQELLAEYKRRLADFYEKTADLKNIRIYCPDTGKIEKSDICVQNPEQAAFFEKMNKPYHNGGVFRKDPGKLVICVREHIDFTGKQLYDLLREKYHLQPEMAERDYVIAMTSAMDTDEGFERLILALREIDELLENEKITQPLKSGVHATTERDDKQPSENAKNVILPADTGNFMAMETTSPLSVRQAVDAAKEFMPIEDAVGRCCGEFLYLYPPGIPILIPGEIITKEVVSYLNVKTKAGFSIQGPEQFDKGMIACVL